MIYIFYAVHILISLFLIMVVLLQQGKGADLSVFGGGSTQAAFGARGAATLLHKLTVACFVIFIFTTLSIGILQRSGRSSSVMTGLDAPAADEAAAGDVAEPVPPTEETESPAADPDPVAAPPEDAQEAAIPAPEAPTESD